MTARPRLAGTLSIGNGGTTGIIERAITNNAALIFSSKAQRDDLHPKHQRHRLRHEARQRSTYTFGSHTYSGGTTISAGTLFAINATGSATGSGNVLVDSDATLAIGNGSAGSVSGNITNNGAVQFNRAVALTYASQLSGTGTVTVANQGVGILTLSGANTYSGDTTVSTGMLRANNTTGSATGSGNITVALGGTLAGTGAVAGNVTVIGKLAPGATASNRLARVRSTSIQARHSYMRSAATCRRPTSSTPTATSRSTMRF